MATTLTTSYKQIFSFKASTYATVKVFAKATQNTSANTSTISMYATLTGTGNSGSFSSGTLKYTLDGQTQSYSLGSTSYGGKTITYNTFTKTRSHASNGTYTNKTISVSISTKGSPNGSGSGTINCATIPRQNSITSVSEADIGSNINIVIGNNSSSFKNTVTWACNGLSGTVVATNGTTLNKVASGTYTWQIPTSILATIPNSSSATITLTNTTYSGTTQIGTTTTATTKANVPNSSRPTLSLVSKVETDESVISALPSSATNFTKPIINLSKPKFTFTATALDGATLNWLYLTTGSNTKAIQLSGTTQTVTYTFENPMTNPIVTFVLYDSRGLTTGTPYTFDGTSQQFVYTNPIFKTVVIKRPNVTQSTVRAEITGVYTPKQLNGSTDNKIWVGFDSREVDGSYSGNIEWYESGVSSNITLDTTNGTWSFNGNLVNKTAAYDKSYYFKVYLKDDVTGQQEFVYMLAKSVPTMSLGENDMQVNGELYLADENGQNVIDVRQALGSGSLIDKIYPVGSIYISTNSTSPATLFGGTWKQIKGRYLIGAGGSAEKQNNNGVQTLRNSDIGNSNWFKLGETGGEYYHKLTNNELPKLTGQFWNTHWANANTYANGVFKEVSGGTDNYTGTSSNSREYSKIQMNIGNDEYHATLSPYLAVNIWERTA